MPSPSLLRHLHRQPVRRFQAGLTFVALLAGGLSQSPAAVVNWASPVNSSWFTTANWVPQAPGAGDSVVINTTTALIQGTGAASALSLTVASGGITVGDFNAGALDVGGTVSVTGGRLSLPFGTVSVNALEVGTQGSYSDTKFSTLILTGAAPSIRLAPGGTLLINSVIAGGSGLNATGPGTLALANINTYSGGTTIGAVSTLQVGTGGTSGSLGAGTVQDDGTLVFNRSDSVTVANLIRGTGSLQVGGNGTIIVTADNTYSGNTVVGAGTLQVGNGGSAGTLGSGNVTVTGSLVFNRSDDVQLNRAVSGTGSLAQAGSGTLTLAVDQTYTGPTLINSGTLRVGLGGTTGAMGSGNVLDNGALVFNRSDTLVVGGQIGGTGTLTQNGTGTLTLAGNNTYSGGTTIASGTLQVGNGGTSGLLGSGNVTNQGALVLKRSDNFVVAADITGAGTLTQAGTGAVALAGNNTYTGGTTIAAGILQIGNGGTAGSLGTGNVTNHGTLAFNRTDLVTIGNVISGPGDLRQGGTGTVIITGNNSYTGGTSVNAGALQVGDGGTSGTLGAGNITTNARLIFNRSDTVTLDNLISGTGSLTQAGASTLVLAANNTYAGTTTINSGTLQVGSGGTSGSLGTGNVANNGLLVFSRSDNIVVDAQIAGGGSLATVGIGTLTLAGNNTYTGGTTITAGTVKVGNGGTSGLLGPGNVTNQGALIFNRSDNSVFSGQVSGNGSLTQAGTGTVALAGANTYSGGTFITAGTLQIGNGGAAGSVGAGDIVNRGTLAINRSDSVTISNAISGPGSLSQVGLGTVILTANNTLTGGATITAGTLQVGNGGTTGTLGTGNITNNARLTINRSDSVVLGNAISGAGSVTQAGAGTVVLTGDNTYSGATIITNGTLQVGSGGPTGTLGTGNITNGGALVFNRSAPLTVGSLISGPGTLRQAGTGTTTIIADNVYTGGTIITAGALQVGDGDTSGSLGSGSITTNGRLIFNRSDAISITPVISGTGSVRHQGTGTLTLDGNNTYSGGTWIENGGTLRITRSATLGTGDLNLVKGTVRADSASPTTRTTITVGGNYTQGAAGVLELGFGGTAANQVDQLKVSGRANLNGTLRVLALTNFQPLHNTKFTVLSATGGVTGRFSDFSQSFTSSPLLSLQLLYNSNDVTIAWAQGSFQPYATTANQLAVARGIDAIVSSPADADIQLIRHLDYDFLANLNTGLPAALESIVPHGLTAMFTASFALMDLQGDQFQMRSSELRADYRGRYTAALRKRAASPAAFDDYVNKTWSMYLETPFNSVTVKGDPEAPAYDLSSHGMTIGGDRRLNEELYVGGSLGYSKSKADLTGGGKVDTSTLGFDLYSVWCRRSLHLDAMVGAAKNSHDTLRQSLGGTASGSTSGLAMTALLGGGYEWQNGSLKIGSQANLQYMSAAIDSFTEEGSLTPLQIQSQSADALLSQLGVDLRYSHLVNQWIYVTPQFFLGWRHHFSGDRLQVDSRFASGAGDTFTTFDPKLGANGLLARVGVSVQWRPTLNTSLSYAKQAGRHGYEANNFQLSARASF